MIIAPDTITTTAATTTIIIIVITTAAKIYKTHTVIWKKALIYEIF